MNALEKLLAVENKARDFGFEWPNSDLAIEQAISECHEIKEVLDLGQSRERLEEEVGDLLHSAISLCVYLDLDVETTLQKVATKFEGRMNRLYKLAAEKGYSNLKNQDISILIDLWREAKNNSIQ